MLLNAGNGRQGYRPKLFLDGGTNNLPRASYPIIPDRKLPDGDGLSLLPLSRQKRSNVPVLVISAMDTAIAKIEGLSVLSESQWPST